MNLFYGKHLCSSRMKSRKWQKDLPRCDGAGKGIYGLIMTLIRTLVFIFPFVWFFGIFLDGGLLGVWKGLVVSGLS